MIVNRQAPARSIGCMISVKAVYQLIQPNIKLPSFYLSFLRWDMRRDLKIQTALRNCNRFHNLLRDINFLIFLQKKCLASTKDISDFLKVEQLLNI